ncbi:glycosyl hydrolase family 61-domain-containing protein [Nemania serpens]|nr:glycosyl hydrolase family 61-domain-containing protein [Nemania serpens]
MTPQYAEMYPPTENGPRADLFAHNTSTATVIAGDEVGFRIIQDYDGSTGLTIFHAGPGQVYLSRADNLDVYVGDGDWFKIASKGPLDNTDWQLIGSRDMNFTIPATTPPGKYLMRFEQVMPMASGYHRQFYISCAHIEVMGQGGGTPTGFAQFPGTYMREDPGLLLESQFENLDQYVAPGPAVWEG